MSLNAGWSLALGLQNDIRSRGLEARQEGVSRGPIGALSEQKIQGVKSGPMIDREKPEPAPI